MLARSFGQCHDSREQLLLRAGKDLLRFQVELSRRCRRDSVYGEHDNIDLARIRSVENLSQVRQMAGIAACHQNIAGSDIDLFLRNFAALIQPELLQLMLRPDSAALVIPFGKSKHRKKRESESHTRDGRHLLC